MDENSNGQDPRVDQRDLNRISDIGCEWLEMGFRMYDMERSRYSQGTSLMGCVRMISDQIRDVRIVRITRWKK